MLTGKTIYCIVTGAHRTTSIAVFLDMLKDNNAEKIVLMPTPAAMSFLDIDTISSDVIIRRESNSYQQIPEEDMVIVAPCTFNTFSKIASGIADNYPLSILHAAIGKDKPVIVAPSMGVQYWWHPVIKRNLEVLADYGIKVVWPEYIYDSNSDLQKITMAPWQKILDFACHEYCGFRYQHRQVYCDDYERIAAWYSVRFASIGRILQEDRYTNAKDGFLAMRLDDDRILVTRSRAMVGNLWRDDLTLVVNSKPEDPVLWCGKYPPSSEMPLILETFEAFPDARVLIHGHCKDVTYSPKLLNYVSDEYLAYGQWGELFKVYPLLEKYGLAIMKLHGEIVMGDDFDDALHRYKELYEKTL